MIAAILSGALAAHGQASAQATAVIPGDESEQEVTEDEYWDQVECKTYNRAASRLRARNERLCLTRRQWREREIEAQHDLRGAERGANSEPQT